MDLDPVEMACLLLLALFGLLLYCYSNHKSTEGFGMDERPFEPENTLLHRNVWDDVDYIVPYYEKTYVNAVH